MLVLFSIYMLLSSMYIIVGVIILIKDSRLANKFFSYMTFVLSGISLINGWYVISENLYSGLFMYRVLIFLNVVVYFFVSIFIVNLTGHENLLNKSWKRGLFSLPFLVAVGTYALFFVDPPQFAQVVRGQYLFQTINKGMFYNSYYYILIYSVAASLLVLLFRWNKKTDIKREKNQSKIIFISMISCVILALIFDKYMPLYSETHIDPFLVIVTALPILGIGYAMKKYNMMNVNPKSIASDMFDAMNDGMIVLDHKLMIKYVNDGTVKLLGYNKQDLLDQNISMFYKGDVFELFSPNSGSVEVDLYTSTNELISLLVTGKSSYDNCGEILSIVLFFQDITEMKNIQNKVLEVNENLEQRVIERTTILNKTNEKLTHEIIRREGIEKSMRYLANHDFLTGLPNRRWLIDEFDRVVTEKNELALVYLDIDDFKNINDSLGHTIGDEVLVEIADRISPIIKSPSQIARIGGDEFLILIEDVKEIEDIKDLLDEIIASFTKPFFLENETWHISASLGVALYPDDGTEFVTLMKNADISLYESKKDGKNNYKFCNELLKAKVKEKYRIINDLNMAVKKGEIHTYYQPKVNQATNKITGFEALARWYNGEHGLISPVKFIPIAEKTGVIREIGYHILETACLQMKAWYDMGYEELVMSVNISVVQLEEASFIEEVFALLEKIQLDPKCLELEITESLLLKNDKQMIDKLLILKTLGIKISMDDFGTEYSSLKYMKYLPIDKVKIDREFVSQININYKDEEIIKSTIQLIKKLGFDVIAEGVETIEQVEFLGKYGCDEIQGYYYYKPMEAEKVNEILVNGDPIDRQ